MQITLSIPRQRDRNGFHHRVAELKDLNARYDSTTKTWTIDTATAGSRLAVWRDYAEYQGMDDIAIIREALKVGTLFAEVRTVAPADAR